MAAFSTIGKVVRKVLIHQSIVPLLVKGPFPSELRSRKRDDQCCRGDSPRSSIVVMRLRVLSESITTDSKEAKQG